jgi:hypothetical protein
MLVEAISREKNVERDVVLGAVESALAAALPLLSAYLTNDSGPMHLAWVQDVPLVALFHVESCPLVRGVGARYVLRDSI